MIDVYYAAAPNGPELRRRLADHEFIADEYAIADIACHPWVVPCAGFDLALNGFPNSTRWFKAVAGDRRAYCGAEDVYAANAKPLSDDERAHLFERRSPKS